MPSEIPMTVTEELFYTDAMVRKEYERLSEEDKRRFDQMKVLAEKIKKETGQYVPIEDLMARVVAQRFGRMTQQNVATVLGSSGEGSAAGKILEKKGDILRIKTEEGSEEERKVILTAIVPNEDSACLAYCVEEDKDALSVSPSQVRTQIFQCRSQKYKQSSRSWPVSREKRQIVTIDSQQRSRR